MPDRSNTVVPQIQPLGEDEFHDVAVSAISDAIAHHGRERVAKAMDITTRQLTNVLGGSTPAPHRIYNLKTLEPGALDKIDRRYGQRSVPRDALCSTDPVSARLAKLLARTIPMESPDSEGGSDASLNELLSLGTDEAELRTVALKLAGWVERIDAYRAGEAPKLRVAK